ncbi:MAG: DUF4266 domain-containing protein [Gammaproteobacteria bacterium]
MKRIINRWRRAAIATGLCLVGCTSVQPWERGHLAKPQMALDSNPMQKAQREHTYGAREAASSGGSTQGGGCGCY